MDIDQLNGAARRKTETKSADGPVRPDPSTPPIGDALVDFHDRDAVLFGIPAHRSGTGELDLDATRWTGVGAFRADVGMNKGVDTRTQGWEVEATAMERFADAVGADETLFSTNGSTENVHVAILAAVSPGETIIVARNGHKSTFAGLVLSGARPVYVDPVYDERWQIAHGVDPAELERVMDAHPEARAVMIFTPSYYGVGSDIEAIAEAVHARGMALITDDAWGLDYCFCSRLPAPAIRSGADLSIGSVHKSLSGLQQTSVLSRRGERIDPHRLRLMFELEQSTSASSLLLSSIDAARTQFERDGETLLGHGIDLALRLRSAIREIPGLELMDREDLVDSPGVYSMDPTHVTFDVTGLGLTGYAAEDHLRRHHRIHVELSDHRRLMVIITYADTWERIERLVDGLRDLARAGADPVPIPHVPSPSGLRLEAAMLPREAFLGETELVPWGEAAGRVSAEMVCPYPPGVPIAAPGERLTATVVDYLEQVVAAGGTVEGAADSSLERLRVVVERGDGS